MDDPDIRDPGIREELSVSVGDLPPDDITRSLEWKMRRFLIIIRVLGWFWMLLLVATTLASDDGADKLITAAAMALATVWTGSRGGLPKQNPASPPPGF